MAHEAAAPVPVFGWEASLPVWMEGPRDLQRRYPPGSLAHSAGQALDWVRRAIGRRADRRLLPTVYLPLLGLLISRLDALVAAFHKIVQRGLPPRPRGEGSGEANGKAKGKAEATEAGPPGPEPPAPPSPRPPAAPPPDWRLPPGRLWLSQLVPESSYTRSWLSQVLASPELAAQLQATPQAARPLRVLCRLLGLPIPAVPALPPRKRKPEPPSAAKPETPSEGCAKWRVPPPDTPYRAGFTRIPSADWDSFPRDPGNRRLFDPGAPASTPISLPYRNERPPLLMPTCFGVDSRHAREIEPVILGLGPEDQPAAPRRGWIPGSSTGRCIHLACQELDA